MNKKSLTLILIIALAVVAFVFILNNKSSEPAVPIAENFTDPNVNAEQLCYIYNTEAGDKAMISMDIRNERVIGEFYWLPFEKDSKTGVFKGRVIPVDKEKITRMVSALWEVSAEGTKNTEELRIIFGGGVATPGFGEMRDRGDGVYVYANLEAISSPINLQQTDCGDEAMD